MGGPLQAQDDQRDRLRARTEGVSWRVVDDELILLDLESGRYFSLNESGTVVWLRLVEGDSTVDQLVDAVGQEYDVEMSRARADVKALVRVLGEAGLVLDADQPGLAI